MEIMIMSAVLRQLGSNLNELSYETYPSHVTPIIIYVIHQKKNNKNSM